jgi:hypothetical protein
MNYLKPFVIGSSYVVFAPFFHAVKNDQPKKTYSYYNYTLLAPVWFGLWNMLSLYLASRFKLSLRMRFLVISVISSLSIMMISTHLKSYNFTREEWHKYYLYIFVKYLIVWNLIIYNIEKYL